MFVMLFAFSSAGYAQISDPVKSEAVGLDAMPVLDDATDHAVMLSERPFTVTGENAKIIGPGGGDPTALVTDKDAIQGISPGALASFEVGWRISRNL
jgi:hypothetical protein